MSGIRCARVLPHMRCVQKLINSHASCTSLIGPATILRNLTGRWCRLLPDELVEWECGEARRARRQQGARGSSGVRLDGVTWLIPAGPPRLAVTAAGLHHRLPCWGYVFHEHDQPVAAGGVFTAQV